MVNAFTEQTEDCLKYGNCHSEQQNNIVSSVYFSLETNLSI
jgi:hypothetical protein